MAKLLRLLAAAGLAVLLSGPAWAGEVLDRVTSSGVLKVSTDPAYPPQSFQNADGTYDGFDIEVAKEIAKRLNAEVEWVTPAWEIITAGRWGGRWDISVGSMTPTAKRAEVLDFPAVYYYTPASFYVHQDSNVGGVDEINGKRIGVCGGCTYENYLNKDLVIDAEGAPPFEYMVTAGEVRTYETDTNVFDELRLGDGVRLDAGLTALPTVQAAIESGYPLRVVGDPVFFEPLSVAIDKGDPEFAAKLNEIVEAMRADGTLSALSVKWYGVDISTVEPTS